VSAPTRTDAYGREVRRDRYGLEYVKDDDGFAFYLTPCCDAATNGSIATGVPATVCRACYNEVDPLLGGVPEPLEEDMTEEETRKLEEWKAWEREMVARALREMKEER
jgi:hypothetical protein